MPREYTDEEKELAERIKDHWRKYCRRWYRGLLDGGQGTLDGAALNMARDTLEQSKGHIAAGMAEPIAEGEAWYGIARNSQELNRRSPPR